MSWPSEWRRVAFLDACQLNPKLAADEKPSSDTLVSFVPMSAVDESRGEITTLEERLFSEVQKGYTPFRNGDVLFAKVTPCMENGKVAIAQNLANGLGFGSTEFHVFRPDQRLLLAEYLHLFIRQPSFRARAAASFVGTGGLQRVPPDFFDRVKLPLPPLPEQQRIAALLRLAEAIPGGAHARRHRLAEVVGRVLSSTVARCRENDWQSLSSLIETKYGTSVRADADRTEGLPVLRIPNVLGGEVDTSDLKYVVLPQAERERLKVDVGDVLIVRSNGNPDYVGRCAAVDERVARMGCVYASYLIRLRADARRLRGTYLAALLNSSIGRRAIRNAIRTTAGQSNLSAESLAGVRLPIPALDIQLGFERAWHEIQSLRRDLDASDQTSRKLVGAMTTEALSGRLTATWREQRTSELEAAARVRDEALAAPPPRPAVRVDVSAAPERPSGFARLRRQVLIDQLSDFQQEVWNTLRHEWRGSVLTDDPRVFDDFCSNPQTSWRLDGFEAGRDEVRRVLEQLAAMGLVRKMSLPHDNPTTRRVDFLTAFRPLREDEGGGRAEEDTALNDAERIARELRRREQLGR